MQIYDPETRREALRRFIEANKIKVTVWCREAGVSNGSVRAFLKGDSNSLTDKTLTKLAGASGVSVGVLTGEAEALSRAQDGARQLENAFTDREVIKAVVEQMKGSGRTVPVYSAAVCDPACGTAGLVHAAALFIDRQSESARANMVVGLESFKTAFIFSVAGNAMSPRYEAGEGVAVASDPLIEPGDHVLFGLKDPVGASLFARFDGEGEGQASFHQYGPGSGRDFQVGSELIGERLKVIEGAQLLGL